jgi:short-subunit dehydrogenase
MDFNNKVVWITGASGGIGEHLAYAFANQGAKLILTARNETELERVKQNCPSRTELLIFKMDVTDFEIIPACAKKVIDTFGRIDILVNNAGISQRSLVKDTLLSVDRKIMEVNYLGTVAVTKAVLPYMIEQQSGQFVVISSLMGKFATGLRSTYAASKHALHGFFDALRLEMLNDNIKVTILCPGFVKTNVSLNALSSDGTKTNKMDEGQAKGYTPAEFAKVALKNIKAEKAEAILGGKEILAVYIKRFFPSLLTKILSQVKTT